MPPPRCWTGASRHHLRGLAHLPRHTRPRRKQRTRRTPVTRTRTPRQFLNQSNYPCGLVSGPLPLALPGLLVCHYPLVSLLAPATARFARVRETVDPWCDIGCTYSPVLPSLYLGKVKVTATRSNTWKTYALAHEEAPTRRGWGLRFVQQVGRGARPRCANVAQVPAGSGSELSGLRIMRQGEQPPVDERANRLG